jgi:hypothetical protein
VTAVAMPPATDPTNTGPAHAHPHQLHAVAAAWNLRAARTTLAQVIEQETAQRRADAATTAAARNIQAWRPQPGRGSGGHGDPVGGTIAGVDHARYGDLRPSRLSRLAARTDDTVFWLSRQLSLTGEPLTALTAAAPHLEPDAAREVWLWLGEADRRIRRALQLDPAEVPVAGNPPCPACRLQLLHVLTAVPDAYVVCRAEVCLCAGDDCPCGMPVREAGVVHIWERMDS